MYIVIYIYTNIYVFFFQKIKIFFYQTFFYANFIEKITLKYKYNSKKNVIYDIYRFVYVFDCQYFMTKLDIKQSSENGFNSIFYCIISFF